ncbi:MAG: hypothetical protein JWO42_1985 [Chloroflexi bacterium]|jgi:hypothetical protein|nr:hypothetical protein [Chloroflexota bacterium]
MQSSLEYHRCLHGGYLVLPAWIDLEMTINRVDARDQVSDNYLRHYPMRKPNTPEIGT